MAETTDPTAAAKKAAATRKENAERRSTIAKKAAQTRAAKDGTAPAKKAAAARKTNAVKRSTTAKKAAQTRAAKSGAAARQTAVRKASANATQTLHTAEQETKSTVKTRAEQAAEVAEKSVLVPLGAALVTRDKVMAAIDELRSTYSTRKKTEAEIKRFERRGNTALKPIRQTRDRVENGLRESGTRLEQEVRAIIEGIEKRGAVSKNVELVGARVENAVQTGRTAATKASTTVQERLATLA